MKKTDIFKNVTTVLHRTAFKVKVHSPEILIVAGIVGTVASAVIACRATTKLSNVLDESRKDIDTIHKCADDESMADIYSKDDAKRDLAIVYAQTGVKLVKLYAPAVALGAISITSIVASNQILRKRNLALAAAYATVDKTFKEYRERVVERFGEDVDHELRYNIKAKTIAETVIDPETGEEKTVETEVKVAEGDTGYAMYFDESCLAYEKNMDYNLMFAKARQSYANDILRTRKTPLTLNDVYDMFGKERTKRGQFVGWKFKPDNAKGDNYVNFRIQVVNRETENGRIEKAILIDPNVDGVIIDGFD